MPTAKTYESWEQVSEIYTVSGRAYVKVRSPKGVIKQVRHYTDAEYAKIYGLPLKVTITAPTFNQKKALGFDNGYITIFKGYDESLHEDFFNKSNARYCRWFGWYVVSLDPVPEPLPTGVEAVRLPWELVGAPSGNLFPDSKIASAIEELLYTESDSSYQGVIGDRIEVAITVTKNISLEGQFGSSNMHVMEDEFKNIYVWTTASKNWPIGTQKRIRGTIKEHKKFHGVQQTVLIRCQEV